SPCRKLRGPQPAEAGIAAGRPPAADSSARRPTRESPFPPSYLTGDVHYRVLRSIGRNLIAEAGCAGGGTVRRPHGGALVALSEFSVAGSYQYNRRGPRRWIASHLLRYRRLLAAWVLTAVAANVINASIPTLIGRAFNVVLTPRADQES